MSKKILITGGAGYIGSYVNKLLNIEGYETVVLDDLTVGDARSVTRGTLVHGDCGDEKTLTQLFEEHHFDGVMHFAAHICVGESIINPMHYYENNVCKTLTLLRYVMANKIDTFIFSSSAAVYGNPEAKYITEDHSTNPINPYGRSKLMVEKVLSDYSAAFPLRYIALRYFNAAGGDPEGEVKNYRHHQTNLIPLLFQSITNEDNPLTIYGTDYDTPDGTCIRDFVHIHDIATAHVLALKKLLGGGTSNTYNLGNGNGFSVREVIAAAEKVTGLKANVIDGARRLGDPSFLVADSAKAKNELAWEPNYPELDTIIEHAWNALPTTV